jgi:hypothetical protein
MVKIVQNYYSNPPQEIWLTCAYFPELDMKLECHGSTYKILSVLEGVPSR